jgi:hypothetical protein
LPLPPPPAPSSDETTQKNISAASSDVVSPTSSTATAADIAAFTDNEMERLFRETSTFSVGMLQQEAQQPMAFDEEGFYEVLYPSDDENQ